MGKYEEDTAAANKLFVEAVKFMKLAENTEGLEEKADALEKALSKLNKNVDDCPSAVGGGKPEKSRYADGGLGH